MNDTELAALHEILDDMEIDAVGRRDALFKSIVIPTPACVEIEDKLLDLYKRTRRDRELFQAKRDRGLPAMVSDCLILAIVGNSHCGKSTAVKRFMEHVLPKAPVGRGTKPMVLASLTEEATIKQMWVDVLRAYGDPSPLGTRQTLENRVETLAARHETEIVAIDECQHLVARRDSGRLSDALKKAVQRSQFALVLIGQPAEVKAMLKDLQTGNRSLPMIEMKPFNLANEGERLEFRGFLAHLDEKMKEYGVFDGRSGLGEDPIWKDLMIASGGYVGVASKLVYHAITTFGSVGDRKVSRSALGRAIQARDTLLG